MIKHKILLLEDSELDAELAQATLRDGGLEFEPTVVKSRDEFVLALNQHEFDVILADYSLPDFDGFEALRIARASTPDIPFIFVSGTLGEDRAIETMHEGATDYVLKQNLKRLLPATQRALRLKREREKLRETSNALHESETKFQHVIESINEYAIISLDLEGRIKSWNTGAERVIGLAEHEVISKHFRLFFTEEDQAAGVPEGELLKARREGRAEDERWQLRWVLSTGGKREERFWASGIVTPLFEEGRHFGYTKIFRDLTKDKLAKEENLRLTQEINTERRKLQELVSTIPGAIWELRSATGPDALVCTYISPYIETLTGYSASEWIAQHQIPITANVTHPDDLDSIRRTIDGVWASGNDAAVQHRWIRKDARIIWVESFLSAIRQDGYVVGLRGVSLDITHRVSIEHDRDQLVDRLAQSKDKIASLLTAAEESERRYRVIAEAMPAIVWASAPAGEVTFINERWVEYTGLSRQESLGRTLDGIIHPEDYANIIDDWAEAVKTGKDFEAEIRLRDKSGVYSWFLSRAIAIRNARGEVEQWIGASIPLDEQKRTRDNLRLLAEASEILASSLDYQLTLRAVTRLAVPRIADWCAVDIVNADGKVERLAVAHVDPEKVKWSYELEKKYPQDWDAPTGVPNVIRTGKSEFYPNIPRDLLLASARDEEHKKILEEIGFTSAIIVPLVARDFVLGAMTFVWAESGIHYTEDDLALAEDIGRRAGVAIDNAWLYQKAQEEIDERKRAEGEVRVSETRFRALVEQSPLSIQIYSKEGYCLQANAAWEQLFNTSREQLEGYSILLDTQLDAKGMRPYVERAFNGEHAAIPPLYYDPQEIGREGRGRWVRAFMYPIIIDGTVQEVALILEDVTDRLEFEEALRKAKESAEAANQAKDKFLAILSHELRTPLTPVLTSVQILEMDENFPNEYREWLDVIHRNVELEARLIDDLLDLTRIAKGKLKLNREKVDIHRLIEHVIDIYRAEIEHKGLLLEKHLDATATVVDGDPARLQQVFWNLIKNAVKFTPQGGSISIVTRNTDDHVVVSVRDTGIGIDETVLPRIFDAFEQGEQTVTRHFGGLGLGLAISKNLVDLHGGRITAHSEGRNKGALFTVELSTQPEGAIAQATPARSFEAGRESKIKPSVLLVDDHVDTSLALKLLLERRGYDVTAANSVENALEVVKRRLAQQQKFDLLISDIGLPDGTGLDLMRALRDKMALKAIAVSGFGTDEDVRRSKEAGFSEHLAKPFSFQKLEEVVRRLLA